MIVLKLCQQYCPEKINYSLSRRLGEGADGEVFELSDQPNRVIKFCVLYEYPSNNIKVDYDKISKTLSYLKINNPRTYARVYEHTYLGRFNRPIDWSELGQDYILYYYVMEKLEKISDDEKRVFHSILCHEDRNLNKNYSISEIKKMLQGMARALDFSQSKVMLFCESLLDSQIIHNDLHVRNVMKDSQGNFKLIDFDRCDLKN